MMDYISDNNQSSATHTPWKKGKITEQKPPLKPQAIWSIRVLLRLKGKSRDLALFNLAIIWLAACVRSLTSPPLMLTTP